MYVCAYIYNGYYFMYVCMCACADTKDVRMFCGEVYGVCMSIVTECSRSWLQLTPTTYVTSHHFRSTSLMYHVPSCTMYCNHSFLGSGQFVAMR
jgi:hypothetical protein